MPEARGVVPVSSKLPVRPARDSRSLGSPEPIRNGWTQSRSSSSSPCSSSRSVTGPKPYCTMFPPSCALRVAISFATSSAMTCELFQVGSVSVLETTHFSIALM